MIIKELNSGERVLFWATRRNVDTLDAVPIEWNSFATLSYAN